MTFSGVFGTGFASPTNSPGGAGWMVRFSVQTFPAQETKYWPQQRLRGLAAERAVHDDADGGQEQIEPDETHGQGRGNQREAEFHDQKHRDQQNGPLHR